MFHVNHHELSITWRYCLHSTGSPCLPTVFGTMKSVPKQRSHTARWDIYNLIPTETSSEGCNWQSHSCGMLQRCNCELVAKLITWLWGHSNGYNRRDALLRSSYSYLPSQLWMIPEQVGIKWGVPTTNRYQKVEQEDIVDKRTSSFLSAASCIYWNR